MNALATEFMLWDEQLAEEELAGATGSVKDRCKYGGFCSDLCNRFVLTILEFHIVNITAQVTLNAYPKAEGNVGLAIISRASFEVIHV